MRLLFVLAFALACGPAPSDDPPPPEPAPRPGASDVLRLGHCGVELLTNGRARIVCPDGSVASINIDTVTCPDATVDLRDVDGGQAEDGGVK